MTLLTLSDSLSGFGRLMKQAKQFPVWIQRIIVGVAVLGGAYYLIGGWVVWAFQFSG